MKTKSAIAFLVGEEVSPSRYLEDQEERALVVAVTETGRAREQAIIVDSQDMTMIYVRRN